MSSAIEEHRKALTLFRFEKLVPILNEAPNRAALLICVRAARVWDIRDSSRIRVAKGTIHDWCLSGERMQEWRGEATAGRAIGYEYAESWRYRERSTADRVNAHFKDRFGGHHLCVRHRGKAFRHLMFGTLTLSGSHEHAPYPVTARCTKQRVPFLPRPTNEAPRCPHVQFYSAL